LFASFVTFLSNKEKLDRFPFPKGFSRKSRLLSFRESWKSKLFQIDFSIGKNLIFFLFEFRQRYCFSSDFVI
jgi:hypothetical protein